MLIRKMRLEGCRDVIRNRRSCSLYIPASYQQLAKGADVVPRVAISTYRIATRRTVV
jgi:hypothetical protein